MINATIISYDRKIIVHKRVYIMNIWFSIIFKGRVRN